MTKKKTTYPIHKMGKHCGYEEFEDGGIKIAPTHSQKMDDCLLQECAVEDLIQHTMAACQKLMVPIKAAQAAFWEGVAEDYSLDSGRYLYSYNPTSKIITRRSKDKPSGKD